MYQMQGMGLAYAKSIEGASTGKVIIIE